MTTHPEAISPSILLTENRWREYTVTLLQTREYEEFSHLLRHASFILSQCANQNKFYLCGQPPLPSELGYYDWSNETAIQLLSLLQDGLAHRLQDVPYSLTSAVSNFLKPRWENGDSFDRSEVLRLGGLLTQDTLVKYLVDTFNDGTKSERLHAFRQTAFTQKLPEEAKVVVLKMLSNQIISAKDRAELLSIEALSARLPQDMGADVVVSRSTRLRRNFGVLRKILPNFLMIDHVSALFSMFSSIFNTSSLGPKVLFRNIKSNYQNVKSESDFTFLSFMTFFSWMVLAVNLMKYKSNTLLFFFIADSLLIAFLIFMFFPFFFRHYGKKVNISDVALWFFSFFKIKLFIKGLIVFLLSMTLFIFANFILGYTTMWLITGYFHVLLKNSENMPNIMYILVGAVITFIFFHIYLLISVAIHSRRKISSNKISFAKLNFEKQRGITDISVLYSADNYEELILWLQNDETLMDDIKSIRAFSSFILSIIRMDKSEFETGTKPNPKCLINKNSSQKNKNNEKKSFKEIRQIFEDKLIKIT